MHAFHALRDLQFVASMRRLRCLTVLKWRSFCFTLFVEQMATLIAVMQTNRAAQIAIVIINVPTAGYRRVNVIVSH